MKRLVLLITSCVLLAVGSVVVPGSASAIIGGEPDGSRHPQVGMVIALDESGVGVGWCTGTLVSPTVVLSAAHCFDPATWAPNVAEEYVMTFRSTDIVDGDGSFRREGTIPGTPHLDPRWFAPQKNGGAKGFFTQTAADIGVLVLDEPASTAYPGIHEAPVIGRAGLQAFASGPRHQAFTVVGYGLQREFDPPANNGYFFSYTRNVTTAGFKKLDAGVLYLNTNPHDAKNGGGTCSGDSGGPVFLGDRVVAVASFVNSICQNNSGSARLDTDAARAFLGQFIELP
jgi:hypothetical protein